MIATDPWYVSAGHWFVGRTGRPLRRGLKFATALVVIFFTVMGVLVGADNSKYGSWVHTWWGLYASITLGIVGLVGTAVEIFVEETVGERYEDARQKVADYQEALRKNDAEIKRLRKENREFFDRNLHVLYDELLFDMRDRITAYEIRIVDGRETYHEIARYSARALYAMPGIESPPHHHKLLSASLEQANSDDPCDTRWFVEDLTNGVKGSDSWCKHMNDIFGIDPKAAKEIQMKSRTLYAYCVGDDTSATTILLFESIVPKRFAPDHVRDVTTKQRELIRYLAQHRPPVPDGQA